jgi:hypothetical protein
MNYLIMFPIGAMAALYLLIIWQCYRHCEW